MGKSAYKVKATIAVLFPIPVIEINWDTLVAADWTDKKSVLIASGDLPDAFLGSNAFNDAEIAQSTKCTCKDCSNRYQ